MRIFLISGAILGFLAVVTGALEAHALKELLLKHDRVETFGRVRNYMFYHAFALILVALLKDRFPELKFQISGYLFMAGSLLFIGTLYLLSLTGINLSLAPFGGICLMGGWISLAILGIKATRT